MDLNQKKYLDDLLDKYLRGECSPDEEKLIDNLYDSFSLSDRDLLKDDPAFAAMAERQILEAMHHRAATPVKKGVFKKRQLSWAIAASLTGLLVGASWLYLSTQRHPHRPIAQTSIHTDRNQRKEITLPDGSEVWLNQFSTLTWTDDPATPERRVQLTGEARFKIAPDAARPFIVEAGATLTKVLGTEFNIEAYPDEKEIKVSLLNGKVQFLESAIGKAPARPLAELLPGHMGTYHITDHSFQLSPTGDMAVDGWIKGAIVFNAVPLQEAIHRMAQRYGWHVQWASHDDSVRLPGTAVTGSFIRETPEEMLAAIAYTNHFKFTIKNKKVTIY